MKKQCCAIAAIALVSACGDSSDRVTHDLYGQPLEYRVLEETSGARQAHVVIEARGRLFAVSADRHESGVTLAIEDDLGERLWAQLEGDAFGAGWLRTSDDATESWNIERGPIGALEETEQTIRAAAEVLRADTYKASAWNVTLPLLFDAAASLAANNPDGPAAQAALFAARSFAAQLARAPETRGQNIEGEIELGGRCSSYTFEAVSDSQGNFLYYRRQEVCRVSCPGSQIPECTSSECTCKDEFVPVEGEN